MKHSHLLAMLAGFAAVPVLAPAATAFVDGVTTTTIEAAYASLNRADGEADVIDIVGDATSAGLYIDSNGATSDSLTIEGNGNRITFTGELANFSAGTGSLIDVDVAAGQEVRFQNFTMVIDWASSGTIGRTNGILVDEADGVGPNGAIVELNNVQLRMVDSANNLIPLGDNPVGSYGIAFGGGWFSTPASTAQFNLVDCVIQTKHVETGGFASGWEFYLDDMAALVDNCSFYTYGPDDGSGGGDSLFFSAANGADITVQNTYLTAESQGINNSSSSGIGTASTTLLLDTIVVENCGDFGVELDEGVVTIVNSSFLNNGQEGLKVVDGTTVVTGITDSVFCNNAFYGIEFNEIDLSVDPIISGCLFVNNGSDSGHQGQFRIGDTNATTATLTIVNSTFHDAATTYAIRINSALTNADIDGCIFTGDAAEQAVEVTGSGSSATIDDSAVVLMAQGDGTFTNITTVDPSYTNTNCPPDADSFDINDPAYFTAGPGGAQLTGFGDPNPAKVGSWRMLD
ncbi:MAG: right-handed parallel beta-helix repeat-containing protein [Sumerlaeia bacterium]